MIRRYGYDPTAFGACDPFPTVFRSWTKARPAATHKNVRHGVRTPKTEVTCDVAYSR